jgi:hypothetical protein
MKSIRYMMAIVVLSAVGNLSAQERASQRAIQEGFREVKEYSAVLLPLCQKSLAQKDYATLLSSGFDLKKATWNFSKMKYMTHNHAKDSAFKACRDSLSRLAIAYADAATGFDTNTVCTLLPLMEQQFEGTAAAIIAWRWLEFEKAYATVEALYNDLLPADATAEPANKKKVKAKTLDLVGVTNTIATEMAAWVASPIPKEVEYRATLIGEEQKYYTTLVDKMKASAVAGDREKLKFDTTNLKVRMRNFVRSYLQ